MKHIFMALLILFAGSKAYCQYSVIIKLKDSKTNEPMIGATVKVAGTSIGTASDANGVAVIDGIPQGTFLFEYKYLGYEEKEDSLREKKKEKGLT